MMLADTSMLPEAQRLAERASALGELLDFGPFGVRLDGGGRAKGLRLAGSWHCAVSESRDNGSTAATLQLIARDGHISLLLGPWIDHKTPLARIVIEGGAIRSLRLRPAGVREIDRLLGKLAPALGELHGRNLERMQRQSTGTA